MSATVATSSTSFTTIFRGLRTNSRVQIPGATHFFFRPHRPLAAPRPFTHTTLFKYPRKDSQDKDSINTEATEYSKSATDDESARQHDAAFDPDVTDPQEQKDLAGKNTEDTNNPLEVSPANPEVSKPRGETEGGSENSSASSGSTSDRQRSSGGGSPSKGKRVT